MYTSFTTSDATFLFNAPMINVELNEPGAAFLTALGGAYESQERHLVSRLLREAVNLSGTIRKMPGKQQIQFFEALMDLIVFLEATDDNGVTLYSSDKRP